VTVDIPRRLCGRGPNIAPAQLGDGALGASRVEHARSQRVIRGPHDLAALLSAHGTRGAGAGRVQRLAEPRQAGGQIATHLFGVAGAPKGARGAREGDGDHGLDRRRARWIRADDLAQHRLREVRGALVDVALDLALQPGARIGGGLDRHGGGGGAGLVAQRRKPLPPVRDPQVDLLLVDERRAVRVGREDDRVLANRLSADPARRVLLLEAGPNFAPDEYPGVIKNPASVATPDYDWHYVSEDADRLGHAVPTPRGRIIGGSSAVNGSVAMRARPTDFQRWTERGIEGWSWEEVLPA
jgi:GMC oxidoreductase